MRYRLDDPKLVAISDELDELAEGVMATADHKAWHELCSQILDANGISDDDFTVWCADRVAALPDYGGR